MEQLAARRAHNPKVAGSSPAPATKQNQPNFIGWAFCILASKVSDFGKPPLALGRRHHQKVFDMPTNSIFLHLKKHGQLLDSEIAFAMGIELDIVRNAISTLVERGEISRCSVTRFEKGNAIEGIQCRVRGFSPPAAPGRKPATKVASA